MTETPIELFKFSYAVGATRVQRRLIRIKGDGNQTVRYMIEQADTDALGATSWRLVHSVQARDINSGVSQLSIVAMLDVALGFPAPATR